MPNPLSLIAASRLAPLIAVLPFEAAMSDLIIKQPQSAEILSVAEQLAAGEESTLVQAAIWLYVDDLTRAHALVQEDDSRLGAAWHAVVHRREGDFSNSYYWWRRARREENGDLVRRVELGRGANLADVVETQREEWLSLFEETLALAQVSL